MKRVRGARVRPPFIKMIIAIAGKKSAGKSTAADFLERHIGAGAIRMSLADPIKQQVAKIFGPYDPAKKEILRPVYQAVGQSAKLLAGETVWLDMLWAEWCQRREAFNTLIIDDVRFPFEAEFLRSHGAIIWKIKCPTSDNHGDEHISETSVDLVMAHSTITNFKNHEYENTIIDEYERARKQVAEVGQQTLPDEQSGDPGAHQEPEKSASPSGSSEADPRPAETQLPQVGASFQSESRNHD